MRSAGCRQSSRAAAALRHASTYHPIWCDPHTTHGVLWRVTDTSYGVTQLTSRSQVFPGVASTDRALARLAERVTMGELAASQPPDQRPWGVHTARPSMAAVGGPVHAWQLEPQTAEHCYQRMPQRATGHRLLLHWRLLQPATHLRHAWLNQPLRGGESEGRASPLGWLGGLSVSRSQQVERYTTR